MDTITLRLPTELHLAIKAIAQRTGRSQATVLREAIRDYVAHQEGPRLRSLGIVKRASLQGDGGR